MLEMTGMELKLGTRVRGANWFKFGEKAYFNEGRFLQE